MISSPDLESRLAAVEQRLTALEGLLVRVAPQSSEPDMAEVKRLVKDFFERNHGRRIDYLDLVEALDLPLPWLVEACASLEKEGKIAPVT
ncbi:MAG: hypothetical protein AB1641_30600 [Thermodesulfobacteriota bacterium]